jgi:hypothetical protein
MFSFCVYSDVCMNGLLGCAQNTIRHHEKHDDYGSLSQDCMSLIQGMDSAIER